MALTKVTTDNIDLSGNTGALTLPSGTTAQRPSSATEGILRNNTTTGALEFYNGTLWQQISFVLPQVVDFLVVGGGGGCLLYTSPSPRD